MGARARANIRTDWTRLWAGGFVVLVGNTGGCFFLNHHGNRSRNDKCFQFVNIFCRYFLVFWWKTKHTYCSVSNWPWKCCRRAGGTGGLPYMSLVTLGHRLSPLAGLHPMIYRLLSLGRAATCVTAAVVSSRCHPTGHPDPEGNTGHLSGRSNPRWTQRNFKQFGHQCNFILE